MVEFHNTWNFSGGDEWLSKYFFLDDLRLFVWAL